MPDIDYLWSPYGPNTTNDIQLAVTDLRIFRMNKVNAMAAVALASPGHHEPCFLTMQEKCVLVSHGEGFQLTAPCQRSEMIKRCKYSYMIPQNNSTFIGLSFVCECLQVSITVLLIRASDTRPAASGKVTILVHCHAVPATHLMIRRWD